MSGTEQTVRNDSPFSKDRAQGLGLWDPRSQPTPLLTLPGTSCPHPRPFQDATRRDGDAWSATSVTPRERPHAGGGSALGTGQSAQTGQARADFLHRRAVAGTRAGREWPGVWAGPRVRRGREGLWLRPFCPDPRVPGRGRSCVGRGLRAGSSLIGPGSGRPPRVPASLPLLLPAGYAGAVRAGQQPRRTDAAEACGHDGPQPEGHPGGAEGGRSLRGGAGPRGRGRTLQRVCGAREPQARAHVAAFPQDATKQSGLGSPGGASDRFPQG